MLFPFFLKKSIVIMILEFLVKISIKIFSNIKKIEHCNSLETVCLKTCSIDQDFHPKFGHKVHMYKTMKMQ